MKSPKGHRRKKSVKRQLDGVSADADIAAPYHSTLLPFFKFSDTVEKETLLIGLYSYYLINSEKFEESIPFYGKKPIQITEENIEKDARYFDFAILDVIKGDSNVVMYFVNDDNVVKKSTFTGKEDIKITKALMEVKKAIFDMDLEERMDRLEGELSKLTGKKSEFNLYLEGKINFVNVELDINSREPFMEKLKTSCKTKINSIVNGTLSKYSAYANNYMELVETFEKLEEEKNKLNKIGKTLTEGEQLRLKDIEAKLRKKTPLAIPFLDEIVKVEEDERKRKEANKKEEEMLQKMSKNQEQLRLQRLTVVEAEKNSLASAIPSPVGPVELQEVNEDLEAEDFFDGNFAWVKVNDIPHDEKIIKAVLYSLAYILKDENCKLLNDIKPPLIINGEKSGKTERRCSYISKGEKEHNVIKVESVDYSTVNRELTNALIDEFAGVKNYMTRRRVEKIIQEVEVKIDKENLEKSFLTWTKKQYEDFENYLWIISQKMYRDNHVSEISNGAEVRQMSKFSKKMFIGIVVAILVSILTAAGLTAVQTYKPQMFEAIEEKYGIKTGDYIPQVEIQENWIPVFKFNPPPPPTYQVQLQSEITGLQEIIKEKESKLETIKSKLETTESKLETTESKLETTESKLETTESKSEEKEEDKVFLEMDVERLQEEKDITDKELGEARDDLDKLVNYQKDSKREQGAVIVQNREYGALVSQILKETASAWKEYFFVMLDNITSFFSTKEKEKIETLETAEANLSKATSLLIRYPKNEARQLEVDIADDKLNLAYINEINNTKDEFIKNKLRRKLYKGLRTIPTVKKESKGKTIESEKDLNEIQKEIKTRLAEKEKKLDELNTTRAEPAPSGGIWSWLGFSAPAAPAAATDGSNKKQLPPPTRYSKRIQRAKNSRKNRVASKKKAKRSISRSKKRHLKGSPKKNRKSKDGGFTVETPITPFNTCKVFKAL